MVPGGRLSSTIPRGLDFRGAQSNVVDMKKFQSRALSVLWVIFSITGALAIALVAENTISSWNVSRSHPFEQRLLYAGPAEQRHWNAQCGNRSAIRCEIRFVEGWDVHSQPRMEEWGRLRPFPIGTGPFHVELGGGAIRLFSNIGCPSHEACGVTTPEEWAVIDRELMAGRPVLIIGSPDGRVELSPRWYREAIRVAEAVSPAWAAAAATHRR